MSYTSAFVILWTVFLSSICKGLALLCYECDTVSLTNPSISADCGPLFKPHQEAIVSCRPGDLCGLQRQRSIPSVRQIAAIARTCYGPGSIEGLDSTIGCRRWTNPDNFTALYCFCDTDLCNATIGRQSSCDQRTLVVAFVLVCVALLGNRSHRIDSC